MVICLAFLNFGEIQKQRFSLCVSSFCSAKHIHLCVCMYQTIDFDAFLNDTFDSLLGCSMIVSFSSFLFLRFCFARNFDTVVSVRNFNNNNNNKKRERIEMIYFFHKYIHIYRSY